MKKSGFTLSEVLLTLGIIGVVAAMTVPSLMSSTEDKKLSTAAKKAYNTIQNAITLKQAMDEMVPEDFVDTNFITYLTGSDEGLGSNVLKVTATDKSATGVIGHTSADAVKIVELPDGQVMTASKISACKDSAGAALDLNGDGVNDGGCATIMVDVNGVGTPSRNAVSTGTSSDNKKLTKMTDPAYPLGAETAAAPGIRTTASAKYRDIVFFHVKNLNVVPYEGDYYSQFYIAGKGKV